MGHPVGPPTVPRLEKPNFPSAGLLVGMSPDVGMYVRLSVHGHGWTSTVVNRHNPLWVESLMVSAATQVSLLRRHGSHSPGQLFSLSLVEAADGFRSTFQWLNHVQLPL